MRSGPTTMEMPAGVAFPTYNKNLDMAKAQPTKGKVLLLRGVHITTSELYVPAEMTNMDNFGIGKILAVGPPELTPLGEPVDLKLEPEMIVLFLQHDCQRHTFMLSDCRRLMICEQRYVLGELQQQDVLAKSERTF